MATDNSSKVGLRYDKLYLCTPKASLVCRTKLTNKKSNEENKKSKNQDAEKQRSSHKVRGVSPEAGRKSMVGKIREEIGFVPGVKE